MHMHACPQLRANLGSPLGMLLLGERVHSKPAPLRDARSCLADSCLLPRGVAKLKKKLRKPPIGTYPHYRGKQVFCSF